MTGEGGFVPATSSGLASAAEICILCEDISFTEDTATAEAYFAGKFNPERIILPYEQDDDDHYALLDAIRSTLRKHGVYLA